MAEPKFLRDFRRKHSKNAWLLKPGDLPTASAPERDSRLRGMEENPVYRYLWYFGRKGAPPTGMGGIRFAIIGLIVLAANLPSSRFILPVPIVFLFLIDFVLFGKAARPKGGALIGAIPTQLAADLLLAGVSAAEVASGFWGKAAARRNLYGGRIMAGILFVSGWILIFLDEGILKTITQAARTGGLFMLFAFGVVAAIGFFYPFPALLQAQAQIHQQRQNRESKELPLKYAMRFVLLIVIVPTVAFGVIMVTVVVARMQPFSLDLIGSWSLGGVLVIMLGGFMGGLVGAFAKLRANTHFATLTDDVTYLMDYARRQVYEPAESKKKWSWR